MLHIRSLFVFLLPWLLLASVAHAHDHNANYTYGVGFSLSLDYGTASVYFDNGTFVDIAKIPGGAAYRHAMTDTYVTERENIEKDPSILEQLEIRSRKASNRNLDIFPLLGWLQQPFTIPLLGWRPSFPSWPKTPPAQPNPLLPMLRALKAATESYLETEITHVEVATTYWTPPSFKEDNRAALASLGLEVGRSGGTKSPVLLWYAKTVNADTYGCNVWFPADSYNSPDEYPLPAKDYVLSVDYTNASFTGIILEYECEVVITLDEIHSSAVGAAAVREDLGAGREGLEHALKELISKSLPKAAERKPHWHPLNDNFDEQLTHLLLMGESADDLVLREALRTVLSEHFDSNDPFSMIDETHGFGDAVFAASRGAARYCVQEFIWSAAR